MENKTILIVEDDKLLRGNLQIYLTARNFRVILAGDVDEAVAILKKETPDMILLDLLLPEKHGTVFLELLKKEGSRIPVIVEDKAATAVDVAESALGAILIPHPYNDVKFPNVLRLENSNQLADAVISLFEAIDDNGALSA